MSDLPKFVELHEEGPREGFQSEKRLYPLADRAALVDALSETGLSQIQVASFVNPRAVPAMADAAELYGAIKRCEDVRYTALWLNEAGFEKAAATPGVDLDGKMFLYTTDAFCLSNNNCTAAELRERQIKWLDAYDKHGVALELVYVLTAFGCHFEGNVALQAVLDSVAFLKDLCQESGRPLPKIYLADTVGWANPGEIKRRIAAVRELVPEARIGLHLHDTRGLGGANFYAALEMGVDLFDSSVAGLGGCPFGSHADMTAAGNVCTEDMVLMCHELGIETGIDLDALIEAARLAERIIGRPLMGRTMHSGSLNSIRRQVA
jgi:isopropylmalate/homocitrate/citramalate synthase